MADKSVETTEITAPKMTDFMDKNEDAIMHDDSIDKGKLEPQAKNILYCQKCILYTQNN